MRKTISFLLVVFLTGTSAFAQPNEYQYNKIYPGYIIRPAGDTVKGFVQNLDNETNQKKCNFYANPDDSKTRQTFKPTELKGYAIEDKHYRTVMGKSLGFLKGERSFMLIDKPGHVTSYLNYTPKLELVWQRAEDPIVDNADMVFGFKKTVLKLVGDCEEIAGKIERKEKGYGMLSIEKIIAEYNEWYTFKK